MSISTPPTAVPTSGDVVAEATARPRIWLVAGTRELEPEPEDLPTVRDGLMHTWCPGADGLMHTPDGRHHATWRELRDRYDLEEVA